MKRIFLIPAVLLLLMLCACAPEQTGEEPPAQPEMFSEVFNDGVTAVETRRLIRLPGSTAETEYCFLEVRLTNNNVEPVYYSSLLCLRGSAGGNALDIKNAVAANNAAAAAIEGYSTIDGEIASGGTAEGFVFFEAPAGMTSFEISLATDFGDDEWVSFSCGSV